MSNSREHASDYGSQVEAPGVVGSALGSPSEGLVGPVVSSIGSVGLFIDSSSPLSSEPAQVVEVFGVSALTIGSRSDGLVDTVGCAPGSEAFEIGSSLLLLSSV